MIFNNIHWLKYCVFDESWKFRSRLPNTFDLKDIPASIVIPNFMTEQVVRKVRHVTAKMYGSKTLT